MLLDYIKNLNSEPSKVWLDNVRDGIPTAAFGVCEGAKFLLASAAKKRVLYIAKDRLSAKAARDELSYLTGEKVVYLPAKDDVLLYKKFFNKDNYFDRICALFEMKNAFAVTTTVEALLQLMPKTVPFFEIEKDGEYSLDDIRKLLIDLGYRRDEFALSRGSFAIRGDILEIFPINALTPYRFDFFGDVVERIRSIDVETKMAEDEIGSVAIIKAVDFTIGEEEVKTLSARIDQSVKKIKTFAPSIKAHNLTSEIKEKLESGSLSDASLSYLMPILSSNGGIFDRFDAEIVVFDEPKASFDYARGIVSEHAERFKTLNAAGETLDFSEANLRPTDELKKELNEKTCFSLQNINSPVYFFSPLKTVRFSTTSPSRYSSCPDDLAVDVKNWKMTGYRSIIACGSAERQAKIIDNLAAQGVGAIPSDTPGGYNDCFVSSAYITHGFIIHDEKLAVIGTCDVFLSGVKEKKIKKKRNDTFSAPEVGDFAVHEEYGIGLVRGTQRITTTDSVKDYIAIEYAEGDVLYIPVEDMDKLTKYLGGEQTPQLNRLGNNEFERIKQRVRESISKMSINLKKLYKERAETHGFKFSEDNDLTREFDEAFPFELTEDQAQSLVEIKADMESDRIMDRLLLGDVGFGKTEVALRAAFKAIMDMKQVAIVAPTTILTEQHYQTVVKRFKDFGVRAGILNRFQKPAAIKKTLEKLKSGDIDIVVGTHRLFGKDVVFHDLGLLILDEEQRFGVEHKEKLRAMKNSVDTLTMSATPIPRTLHMSLMGIRDISLILTPPSARIPVQSYVIEESETLIRDAILKELSRGGQTFILYNDVQRIYGFSDEVKRIVPEAKVVVGHGQMTREELEDHIMAFYEGVYDVLVATTIIENGIDIPRANTLVVIDSDKLGLFSLYQLKGRVGRSDVMAHAYFTYKPDKVLTDASYKRLNALMESSELGSGYKIAMRDLEIRGAGNVLGREQHGHLDKIGYELYSKLLKEQLGEVTKNFETELDIKLDAFIPESYISVSSSRLDLYKALAEIKDSADAERVVSSAVEIYGKLPVEVENLLLIAELKNLCKDFEIINLKLNKSGATLTLKDLNSLADGRIMQAVKGNAERVRLSFSTNPVVNISGIEAREIAAFTKRFLICAKEKEN